MDAANLARLATAFQPVFGVPLSIRPLRADDFEIDVIFRHKGAREFPAYWSQPVFGI